MTDIHAIASGEPRYPVVAPLPSARAAESTPQAGSAALNRVSELLGGLKEVAVQTYPSQPNEDTKYENRLALVRLGIATSLFYALRAKHAPTASHSLRVALVCSAWTEKLGLSENDRDRIEVAALLHDIGKIGIPDQILRKPGKLSVEEQLVMDQCASMTCEILAGCAADTELLDIVRLTGSWYNSRRYADSVREAALPLGARIVSIANAFDSMTTEHVYRRALSREQALEQLFAFSGTQFDPELTLDFARLLEQRPEVLHSKVVHRWLQQLRSTHTSNMWTDRTSHAHAVGSDLQHMGSQGHAFYEELLSHMNDGVAFTDSQGIVVKWNAALQQLTDVAPEAAVGTNWNCNSFRLVNAPGSQVEYQCPVSVCLKTHAPQSLGMYIEAAGGELIPVHVRVAPVKSHVPGAFGTVVVIRDVSDQANLQERVETLRKQVTLDSLTGVANRAEFDRRITELTELAAKGGPPFCLIICDIDHFKRVNDVHGHPAGDEALVRFAGVLSRFSREGDLVARYGGEEFVLLAVGCDNATAAKRAELIREALSQTPLPSLGNEAVTASFGVTQYQAGDSAETILARADRALLRAKDSGRNRVIQLGSGSNTSTPTASPRKGWFSWFGGHKPTPDRELDILTTVPTDLAIEKLKGFIADHEAEILSVRDNQVSLRVNAMSVQGGRRRLDQQIALNVVLTISEARPDTFDKKRTWSMTKVHLTIKPIRNRDRRRQELDECTDTVVASLKSYLMGDIYDDENID